MSTFKVTIEKLTILEHPNADALELAQVGLYRAVVGKGQYKTGEYAVYIPEQAVLPAELIEELGLTGRLAGRDKNRVKAIRLRGELSQGIVCRPHLLSPLWDGTELDGNRCDDIAYGSAQDFAEELGITKWTPPVPIGMAGVLESAPDLLPWVDIENIKRYPDMFIPGEPVVATEKIHGSCCLVTYVRAVDELIVSSKGVGAKSLAIKESDTNIYWRAVRQHDLKRTAQRLAEALGSPRVGLFGEVYGKGVQDLHYGREATSEGGVGYALFDISFVDRHGASRFVGAEEAAKILATYSFDIPTAPVLYEGPYDYELLEKLAEGKEQVSGRGEHIREGLVVRPLQEARNDNGRVIAKFVSGSYLTRGGEATEYE